jgi:hypothetical protein
MNDLNSKSAYWLEVNAIAAALVFECMSECDNDREEAEELLNDSRLHETIDGHQWIIYYAYNLPVLNYSDNTEYGIDNGLVDCQVIKDRSLNDFHTALAFWALYADVQNALDVAFNDFEEKAE